MIDLAQRLASLSPEKRRLLEERLRRDPTIAEPIAIVGMACRFPGAPTLEAYWRLIHEGIDATREIPSSRWDVDGLYDPSGEQTGKMSVRWAGLVDDIDQFDPQFFGISPREAARMDPQQRLLLEVAWEAFEQACLPAEKLAGSSTGVFVGIGGTDYSKLPAQFADYFHHIDAHVGTGNALSIAANRVSYIFDLRGPSLAVDTACSSSTMGVHLAIQALRNRECDAALAGGVNAILTPETTIAFSKAKMLSPDGKCRPFDAEANGYVRGEGCGMLVLKRLTDATRDGDPILAVIRASATNQDGRTSGITAPNGLAQQATIRAALKQAGLKHQQIGYIEAHGTGTPLGDPIEFEALSQVFSGRSDQQSPCYVTSVKANVGHMETVSGVAGMIKVVLMMQHGFIPGQLHLKQLNPRISLEGTRLLVPSRPVPWPVDRPLLAGVSSFGFGGANTHVILESASVTRPSLEVAARPKSIMPLSAKSEQALQDLAGRYHDYLSARDTQQLDLADICFTAAAGRSHLPVRAAVVTDSRESLLEELAALRDERSGGTRLHGPSRSSSAPRVAFLFTGQGSQYPQMGRELYETQPVFRRTLDRCQEILREELDVPLLTLLFPGAEEADHNGHSEQSIHETCYTQPCLFALEYALAELWRSWGVEPHVVLGHSVGEYAAACVAGILDLEDGLRLIARRAQLMQSLPRTGSMAVIFAGPREVEQALSGHPQVGIAAYNGPQNTVISGQAAAVQSVIRQFAAAGITAKALQVSHAFHSSQMDPILDDFEDFAQAFEYRDARIPLIANLTGAPIENWGPHYLREHIREPVRFAGSMEGLAEFELDAFVEIGPTASLLGMGRRCVPEMKVHWLPSLRSGQPDWNVLLGSLGELYRLGASIDWKQFDRPWQRRWTSLPTYAFQRERFWLEPNEGAQRDLASSARPAGNGALLGPEINSPLPTRLFQTALSARRPGFLQDHQVQQSVVFPAAGYLEIALSAGTELFAGEPICLRNVVVQQAMFLNADQPRQVHTSVANSATGLATWEIYSRDPGAGEWTLHASGQIEPDSSQASAIAVLNLEAISDRLPLHHSREEFYQRIMAERQLDYGPAFQVLADVRRSDRESLARIELQPEIAESLDRYRVHPSLGDALFQTAAGLVPLEEDGSYSPYTYMPTGVRQVQVHRALTEPMFTYGVRTSSDDQPSPETVEGDLALVDQDGQVLVEFRGICLRRVGSGAVDKSAAQRWLHDLVWEKSEDALETGKSERAESYLLLANQRSWMKQLADDLRRAGKQVITVRAGDGFRRSPDADWDYEVDPLSRDDYEQLFAAQREATSGNEGPTCEVVHAWSLDLVETASDAEDFAAIRRCGCGSLLQLLHALSASSIAGPRLTMMTRGGQAVTAGESGLTPSQATLWGLGRVAAIERPELQCRLIDLDSSNDRDTAPMFIHDLLTRPDDQWAYRGGARWVPRLRNARTVDPEMDRENSAVSGPSPLTVPERGPYQLRLKAAGSFDSLSYVPAARGEVQPGEVELRVAAAGLNFSDVLKAMGLYPGIKDDIVPLGIECAGEVTAVGEGVTRFAVGDRVLGIAPYSFASHARTAEYCLVPLPEQVSPAEAVTIPITFLTAHHALVRLADLQAGERVLIHAGAGGVGLAAIQIAQRLGATVYATAGSDEKREYLRALGVEHVLNSRTLEFADEIRRLTEGEGIDVVLNSLPGEAIPASLSLLRAYGRFLEIGKTDIYQNRMLGLEPFQDNLSYFAIDLDRMLRQRPEQIRHLFAEVMSHFEKGEYRPLAATEFDVTETVDAFRYMAKRKNIGKVVVRLATDASRDEAEVVEAPAGTCLITGGLGALGLRVAAWVASGGASEGRWTHLALLSRRAPNSDAEAAIQALRELGCEVQVLQGDVSDRESLHRALEQLPHDFPPVRAVFHAAGALADGLLFEMDAEQFDVPLQAKVDGTWNLHHVTSSLPVDHFVLFSSIACLMGSPGQANYAAANAFLDQFAAWRRSHGLPATSINWGPWAESGMATRAGTDSQLESRGMRLLKPDACLRLMNDVLQLRRPHAAVLDVDWPTVIRSYAGNIPSLLAELGDDSASGPNDAHQVDQVFLTQLRQAEDRVALLRDYFAVELARIMGLDRHQLNDAQPLNELGLDSLLAMELKNNLERRLDFTLPMAAFMDAPSLSTLSEHAATALGRDDAAEPGAATEAWTPLVPLQPNGQQSTLYCLHPLGGDIGCYRDLALAFGETHPLCALRGRGSDGELEADPSLESMIHRYADALLQQDPAGSFELAGWSAGGIYAYELAREIRQRGATVRQLLLFDTPLPSIYDHVELNDHARFLADFVEFANMFLQSNMKLDYEQLQGLDEDAAFAAAMREAESKNVVAGFGAEARIRHLVDVGKTHARFIKQYQLEPIDIPVQLILPQQKGRLEQASGQRLAEDLGWGAVLGDRLQVHQTPGDHFTMMLGEHAAALANLVRGLLANSAAADGEVRQ